MINYSLSVQDLEYFLLILTRVSCFVQSAPFFNNTVTPRRVKTAISVFVSFLIYSFVVPHNPLEYNTLLGYAILVIREASCGLIIGFLANICMHTVLFAGSLIDMDIGLSMVSLFDPVSKSQAGFTGILYQYALLLILLATNFHHYLLRAFVKTFELIPLGAVQLDSEKLFTVATRYLSRSFEIAFEIFLPVFATMLLLNVVLGIMAKVAPQMNMFAVGIQLKILVGMSVLILASSLLPYIADFIFGQMKSVITEAVNAMR